MATTTLKRLGGPVAIVTTDGEKVLYTCPSATVAIVKTVRFVLPSTGTAQTVSWGILPNGQTAGTGARWVLQDMDLGPADPVTDQFAHILGAGDKIIALVSGTGATVTVSGAEVV